jgi:Arm DNA-binding domain
MAERHFGDTLMALTAAAIKSAKPKPVQFKLTDSDGLHLLVLPNGGRYWRMNYRFNGKHKTLASGVWPDVNLADARTKRDVARRLIANGIDPAEKAKQDKVAASVAAANTFEAVADELLAKTERTGHGFRAMTATLLDEMGIWNADAIERQLGSGPNKRIPISAVM